MKLRSFSYLFSLLIILFSSPLLSEEKIDIWKNKKEEAVTITPQKKGEIKKKLNSNSSQPIKFKDTVQKRKNHQEKRNEKN